MWEFGLGVIIGIYLGTYYDFRPILESFVNWGSDRLPPPRTKKSTASEQQSFLMSFFVPGKK